MNIKKIKSWQVILGTLVLLSVPTLFVISLERYTTSNEDFCMTCHYKMWGEDFLVHSNIHPDSVRCPQCHANHKEIIPKDFSADSDRVNPNCVRCHGDIFKKSDTEGFKYNVMNIKMPHKFHLQEVEAKCVDCHYNIKHDKFHPITNRPRMEVCFECHDEETTRCSKCHTRGSIEVLAALPVSDTVEQKFCEGCHEDFQSKQIPFYGLDFSHPIHLKQRLQCGECHSNANLHGQIVKTREECMQCHHQSTQRECTDCHKFEDLFRNGTALTEIKGEPDVMAEMVSCDGCHAEIAEGHSKEQVLGTCSMCHEEPDFEKKVDEIQMATEESIREIENLLKQAIIVGEGLPESSQEEIQTLIKHGEDLLKILKKDRSLGFHNNIYSTLLVKDAKDSLEKVIFEMGTQPPPTEN
jgi:hypothetical protein